MDEGGTPPMGAGTASWGGRESFLAWTKAQRAQELLGRLPEDARRGWTFDRLVGLLQALGLQQPRQYLEAGWWVPEAVRRDPQRSDALYRRIQEAMARGTLPPADAPYTWDDVRRLIELCDFTPDQLFAQLAHVYALTLGEAIFVETVQRVVGAPARGGDGGAGAGEFEAHRGGGGDGGIRADQGGGGDGDAGAGRADAGSGRGPGSGLRRSARVDDRCGRPSPGDP